MRFYWLAVGVLGVWRVTHLLYAEDGPWAVLARLRRRAGTAFAGQLMDCFYCLSLWIAFPLACLIGDGWRERLLLWPALSAGAILLERTKPLANYHEDPEEESHALLRQPETTVSTTVPTPAA